MFVDEILKKAKVQRPNIVCTARVFGWWRRFTGRDKYYVSCDFGGEKGGKVHCVTCKVDTKTGVITVLEDGECELPVTTMTRVSIKSSALLACPFCGSTDVAVEETDSGIGGLHGEYHVVCWACYSQTGNHETKSKAKKAWNRRRANKAVLFGATTAAFALAFGLIALSQGAFGGAQ